MVMPLWLNLAPAKVVMPAAGTSMAGTLLVWQISQARVVGRCSGARLAMFLGQTPSKVLTVTLAPWQLSQPVLMPAWLNKEPEKRAPSCTGVEVTLEPGPTWQLSQPSAPMGMWRAVGATILSVPFWLYRAAFAALWHCAQLRLMLGALAWILDTVGKAEKSPWQAEHTAPAATGICTAGREGEVKSLKLPWQLEHSPWGCVASATK